MSDVRDKGIRVKEIPLSNVSGLGLTLNKPLLMLKPPSTTSVYKAHPAIQQIFISCSCCEGIVMYTKRQLVGADSLGVRGWMLWVRQSYPELALATIAPARLRPAYPRATELPTVPGRPLFLSSWMVSRKSPGARTLACEPGEAPADNHGVRHWRAE
jgi:hypothetical protein